MLRNRWGLETHEASLAVVHGAVQNYSTIRDMVFASRGFTMSSANTRRPPNALNFLRQAEVLANAGMALENQFQELGNQIFLVQTMVCWNWASNFFWFKTWFVFFAVIQNDS